MTNEQILRIALEQSAIDANCRPEDFTRTDNVIVPSVPDPRARRYLKLPHVCNLISYGSNIVATINERYREPVAAYIDRFSAAHCFETPNLHILDEAFRRDGYGVCFMAEYFLPDIQSMQVLPCAYETRLLHPADFADLYTPAWSNALCAGRKEYDVLGVGAYDGGKLIGLAACSADCDTMWQIGIDVLPEYRHQGVASALTSRLAAEILREGMVPFYCCAWANIPSARNAVRCGFRPAWAELTVKRVEDIDKYNLKTQIAPPAVPRRAKGLWQNGILRHKRKNRP